MHYFHFLPSIGKQQIWPMLSHTMSWSESRLKGEGDSLPAECISFFHNDQIQFLSLFLSLSNYCSLCLTIIQMCSHSSTSPILTPFAGVLFSFFFLFLMEEEGECMYDMFLCAIEIYVWEKEQLVHGDQNELLLKWGYFIGSCFFNEQLLIQSSLPFGGWMVRNVACSRYINIDTNRYTKYITNILYLYVLSW